MNRCLLPLCACLLGILAFAQENPVLMRVNGREVSRSEFEYSYHHYRAGGGRDLSPKEYALLFSQAIQKVEAAKAIRLDTTAAFRKQQEENRIKLMGDCLVDKQTVDSCVRVSYQKMALKARTGKVQVMQIFKYLPQTITSRHLEEEKARMDSIIRLSGISSDWISLLWWNVIRMIGKAVGLKDCKLLLSLKILLLLCRREKSPNRFLLLRESIF